MMEKNKKHINIIGTLSTDNCSINVEIKELSYAMAYCNLFKYLWNDINFRNSILNDTDYMRYFRIINKNSLMNEKYSENFEKIDDTYFMHKYKSKKEIINKVKKISFLSNMSFKFYEQKEII